MIPYGRQFIDADDIAAVVEVLKSDWLTTGPKVEEFERAFAAFTGSQHAVAVSNGTAALHAAVYAAGIGPGDEVIVTPMSFAASANCVVYQGGRPVFVDVRDEDLLIDPEQIERVLEQKVAKNAKAIIAVDYSGMTCDYDRLRDIARRYGLVLIADACHALGGSYKGRAVGSLADLSTFSFHPVKNMTTGEGGAVTTDNPEYAGRLRLFRSHGITVDFKERMEANSWFYEMVDLGWNYRITDFQCALGLSQLKKLPGWIVRRNEIAATYDAAFAELAPQVRLLHPITNNQEPITISGRHLYVIRVPAACRAEIFAALRKKGIGVNVHYIPIHLHPFYRQQCGTKPGLCPVAEKAYEELITLPLFAGMSDHDVDDVIAAVHEVVNAYCR
ncbi:MAG: UDP-4-amino-4,6-dideoxy-N-acetyl-beta-L-altrosamine transaminase [Phycisphaerae bacterium]|nr:UDP-4-amino-4,6-dideoxy-N-acetyl-beta-L-altrosamine transaminase [Phycisphaerae bacterium]